METRRFKVLSYVREDEAIVYNYRSLMRDEGQYTTSELRTLPWLQSDQAAFYPRGGLI